MTQATEYSSLQLISHERSLFSGKVYSVHVRTSQGPIEILPHHEPILCIVLGGVVKIKAESQSKVQKFLISGGVMEVFFNRITLLTTTGSSIESMSDEEIQSALQRTKNKGTNINLAKSLEQIETNTPQQVILQEIQRSREV